MLPGVSYHLPHPEPAGIDGFFKITERGSTVAREVRGGLVTFLTMAYIIVLNPLILGFVPDADGDLLGGAATVRTCARSPRPPRWSPA